MLFFLPPSVNHKKWQGLWWMRLPGPELQLSKLTSTIRTTPNPYYFQVGLGPVLASAPRAYGGFPVNVILLSCVLPLLLRTCAL